MALYYPQGAVLLRVRWEDFGTKLPVLQEIQDLRVSCRSLTVERNDYREADTFKAQIDYKAFPFDPRTIRSCGISIFMEDRKKVFNEDNSLALIEPSDENKVFIGFVDEGSINFDDSTRTVSLEGRDFTALFLDTKRINSDPISLSRPIDELIKSLIDEQEATKEIKIDNRTGESKLPTLSALAPDFNEATSVKNQKRRETYWDIIQDIVGRTGLVGFIEMDKFVITKPKNIYEKKEIKHFIYGGNIKELSFTRKLGRAKDFNVAVKSVNLGEKKVETALIPKEAITPQFIANFGNTEVRITQMDKDGKRIKDADGLDGKPADYMTFLVKDVKSKNALIQIGESIFEEISRQQIEGSLQTYEMEIPEELDTGTSPIKFSKIRNGTAIRVFLSQDELEAINSDSDTPQKQAFLIRRGYPADLAKAFAESLNRINTAFYVKGVTFEMDQENGFSMKIDFINFIDLDSAMGVR
jgi:hypothetical protein